MNFSHSHIYCKKSNAMFSLLKCLARCAVESFELATTIASFNGVSIEHERPAAKLLHHGIQLNFALSNRRNAFAHNSTDAHWSLYILDNSPCQLATGLCRYRVNANGSAQCNAVLLINKNQCEANNLSIDHNNVCLRLAFECLGLYSVFDGLMDFWYLPISIY